MEGARRRMRRRADRCARRCSRACGAIPSTHDYHFKRFLAEAFPHGTAFPAVGRAAGAARAAGCAGARVLDRRCDDDRDRRRVFGPRAAPAAHARSASTSPRPRLRSRAARALDAIARDAAVDRVHAGPQDHDAARRRRSTRSRCAERTTPPALSLYVETDARRRAAAARTALERVPIAANLRLDTLERSVRRRAPSPDEPPWTAELRALWRLAERLAAARGKPDVARIDYSFYVDWDAAAPASAGACDRRRAPRGSPARQARRRADDPRQQHLWGRLLAEARRPRALSRAGGRQGQDEHAARRASGPRRRALPVGELAAAPLQRPRQPAAADRGGRRRRAAVRRGRRRAVRRAGRFRGDVRAVRRIPGPDGALLVPALAAAGERDREHGDASCATISCASTRCRSSCACPTCRRCAADTRVRVAIGRDRPPRRDARMPLRRAPSADRTPKSVGMLPRGSPGPIGGRSATL